jgi:hypothetical protein
MKTTEYKQLQKQVEGKYKKAVETAQKQRIEALAAIDTVWSISHKLRKRQYKKSTKPKADLSSTIDTTGDKINERRPNSYGSLIKAVTKALDYVPRNFTKNHVKMALMQVSSEIAHNCKDSSLTGCLIRLEKKGIFKRTRKGKGSAPSKYKKIDTNTKAQLPIEEEIVQTE